MIHTYSVGSYTQPPAKNVLPELSLSSFTTPSVGPKRPDDGTRERGDKVPGMPQGEGQGMGSRDIQDGMRLSSEQTYTLQKEVG